MLHGDHKRPVDQAQLKSSFVYSKSPLLLTCFNNCRLFITLKMFSCMWILLVFITSCRHPRCQEKGGGRRQWAHASKDCTVNDHNTPWQGWTMWSGYQPKNIFWIIWEDLWSQTNLKYNFRSWTCLTWWVLKFENVIFSNYRCIAVEIQLVIVYWWSKVTCVRIWTCIEIWFPKCKLFEWGNDLKTL